jgi:hypothetical protein
MSRFTNRVVSRDFQPNAVPPVTWLPALTNEGVSCTLVAACSHERRYDVYPGGCLLALNPKTNAYKMLARMPEGEGLVNIACDFGTAFGPRCFSLSWHVHVAISVCLCSCILNVHPASIGTCSHDLCLRSIRSARFSFLHGRGCSHSMCKCHTRSNERKR